MDASFLDSISLDTSTADTFVSDTGSDAPPFTDTGTSDLCEEGVCDPTDVEACTEETSCVLTADGPACVELLAPGERGAPCDALNGCAAGLSCFLKRDGGECGRPCCATGSACEPGESCGGANMLVDGSTTTFGECLPPRPCNVLSSASCEPSEACYIVSSTGTTDCLFAGEADVGERCAMQNDCAGGLFCAGISDSMCVRICELGVEGSCPAMEGSCQAYAQSPPGTGLCTREASRM